MKGKLIPIETENEAGKIALAASNSEAYALPMRPKEEISNLTTLYNDPSFIIDDSKPSLMNSLRSSIIHVSDSSRPRNGFIQYALKILGQEILYPDGKRSIKP